jgi:hypothetical protein
MCVSVSFVVMCVSVYGAVWNGMEWCDDDCNNNVIGSVPWTFCNPKARAALCHDCPATPQYLSAQHTANRAGFPPGSPLHLSGPRLGWVRDRKRGPPPFWTEKGGQQGWSGGGRRCRCILALLCFRTLLQVAVALLRCGGESLCGTLLRSV